MPSLQTQSNQAPRRGALRITSNDRAEVYAAALLLSLKTEMSDADYFTREDLLHLSAFQHVATITRYKWVGGAVQLLLDRGDIVAVPGSRTELTLRGRVGRAIAAINDAAGFERTVARLLLKYQGLPAFTVMDVVGGWRSDPHLTLNAKRVATRRALQALAKEGRVEKLDPFSWCVAEKGAR